MMKKMFLSLFCVVYLFLNHGCAGTNRLHKHTFSKNSVEEMTHEICGTIHLHKLFYGQYPSCQKDLQKANLNYVTPKITPRYLFYPQGLALAGTEDKIILINQAQTDQEGCYCVLLRPGGQLDTTLISHHILNELRKP